MVRKGVPFYISSTSGTPSQSYSGFISVPFTVVEVWVWFPVGALPATSSRLQVRALYSNNNTGATPNGQSVFSEYSQSHIVSGDDIVLTIPCNLQCPPGYVGIYQTQTTGSTQNFAACITIEF